MKSPDKRLRGVQRVHWPEFYKGRLSALNRLLEGEPVYLLAFCFSWGETDEGFDYWSARSTGVEPLSDEDWAFLNELKTRMENEF